ncbi:MAG: ribosomal RNA small subunit methyltransferase A [Verrucomicrobiae bacterium]|nr:ribosomal RNA small subunit methyltransferase A [Verrucomicrobiae bacterium]
MTDRNMAAWIVNALRIEPDDTVIEIGPGTGALTEHVVGKCRHLILVEADSRLAAYQREKYADRKDVTVIEQDAVQFDLRPYFKEQPIKVLGALPYSSGTEIVRTFMRNPSPAARAVFTLQKEVCERLTAVPGTKACGKLSLRVQARWNVRIVKLLPPELFLPRPQVDSGVVVLEPRDRREMPSFDETLLDRLARLGFSQRRKQLKKLLPAPPIPWEELVTKLGTSPTCRGEELNLRQWIDLTNVYDDHPLKDLPQSAAELFDVVDDKNNVICQKPRGEVHAQKLHHRAVHVFVLNPKGDLFLQKRSHLKDAFPGAWDSSAAGHLDVGESYADCAVRELDEELGIQTDTNALAYHATIDSCENTGWEFVQLFSVQYKGKLRFPCSEVECGNWFSLAEVKAWGERRPQDFAAGFLECLKQFEATGT